MWKKVTVRYFQKFPTFPQEKFNVIFIFKPSQIHEEQSLKISDWSRRFRSLASLIYLLIVLYIKIS